MRLDVERVDEHTTRVATDPSFWNATSAFGGWVAAVVIKTVRQMPEFRGEVLTQQMQFIRPISADQILVRVQLLAQRKTIDFWRIEIFDADERALVTADLTSGIRQPSDIAFETLPPSRAHDAGVAMELTPLHPTWTAYFEQVMIEGEPFTVADRPRSLVRARPLDDALFDETVLAMLCDSPMPRTFLASTGIVFASTISLGIHIYASDEEIAAVERDFVVVEAESAVIRNNTLNQEVRIFRHDGLLLACSYQTAVFKSPDTPNAP